MPSITSGATHRMLRDVVIITKRQWRYMGLTATSARKEKNYQNENGMMSEESDKRERCPNIKTPDGTSRVRKANGQQW